MEIKEILWKPGFVNRGADAWKVNDELDQIRAKHDGDLPDDEILKKARSKRSAMHRLFEWDDSIAGHEYRVIQSHKLTRSIDVVYEESPNAGRVRMYEVKTRRSKKNNQPTVYTTTEDMMATQAGRDELLNRAIRDLLILRKKFHAMTELSKVFEAIDSAVEELAKS